MERTFYSDTPRQVLDTLDTDPDQGLTQGEGARRLAGYGENKLEKAKPPGLFRQVLAQLRDPMILVLLAAAALSFFAGGGQDWLDTAIILLIVVFNTVISVSQEDNARKALEALEKLAAPRARVLREGVERRLESTHLVPGDILLLEAGDYVPADGRILWAAGLQTDESAMTGESLPVHKRAGDGLPPDTPLAERKNMVIGGTVVTGGRAKVVVTATGMQTEMGKIAGLLLRQGQSFGPVFRLHRGLSFAAEVVAEYLPKLSLVLRDQNTISHGSPSFASRIPGQCVPSVSAAANLSIFLVPIIPFSLAVCHIQFLPLCKCKKAAHGFIPWAAVSYVAKVYIFSGASTPRRARPFFRTLRVVSASFSRAASTAGASPLMRQAV